MLGGAAEAPKQRLPALPRALANACRQRIGKRLRDTLQPPRNSWKNRGPADVGVAASPPTAGFFSETLCCKQLSGNDS